MSTANNGWIYTGDRKPTLADGVLQKVCWSDHPEPCVLAVDIRGGASVVVFSADGFHDGTYRRWMQIPTPPPRPKTREEIDEGILNRIYARWNSREEVNYGAEDAIAEALTKGRELEAAEWREKIRKACDEASFHGSNYAHLKQHLITQ